MKNYLRRARSNVNWRASLASVGMGSSSGSGSLGEVVLLLRDREDDTIGFADEDRPFPYDFGPVTDMNKKCVERTG